MPSPPAPAAAATDFTLINIGGPCKIIDNSTSAGAAQVAGVGGATVTSTVLYTEGDVTVEPQPTWRPIASSLGGEQDAVLADLTWKISGVPKPIWDAAAGSPLITPCLLPGAYFNFTATGARLIGGANRYVTILGADGEQYIFTRAAVTKPPELFLGLGKSLYGAVEWTAFLGQAALLTDVNAFYAQTTGQTWSQTDYPTGHQEALCSANWGTQTGWTTVFAEDGFTLTHELKLEPVKQGNILVDHRIGGYRAMMGFKPQGPTSAELLSALGGQGAGAGIGARQSSRAYDFVVQGAGISVTVKSAALHKGQFVFSNKLNRPGEWGMITSLTTPGTRLVFA